MNQLFIGFSKQIEIPKSGLFIDDEIPEIEKAKLFDVEKHFFNPLQHLTPTRARQIADVLYTTTPGGSDTLTVRNGRRNLARALMDAKRFDEVKGDEEVMGMIDDILFSPLLRRIFCESDNQFKFTKRHPILVRLNRPEIGDFDALVIGLLLMSYYDGQITVPDFGFYGRLSHVSLIRQNRIIAGLNTLNELEPKLRQSVLLIKDKIASASTYDDAATLAQYAGLQPGTIGYNDFITDAMQ